MQFKEREILNDAPVSVKGASTDFDLEVMTLRKQ